MATPARSGVARTPAWARALDRLPPAVRHRLAELLGTMPASGAVFDGAARGRCDRLLVDAAPWLGAEPALAELGYWMIEPGRADELRRQGCRWLAHLPSVETARRLSALVLDAATPPPVREQAIRALGARELRAMHPAVLWPAEAVQLADEALVRVATDAAAGRIASEALPHALRHVASDGIAAVFARAPGLWGDAIECFAPPPLARVLAVSIEDLPAQHRLRAVRLVAATLGEEAVPVLLARSSRLGPAEQLEILLIAIALGGEAHLGRLEAALRGARNPAALRGRATWHLQHRGVVPTVRGLRVARTTATIPADERAARCAQAADDLAALTHYERHTEGYVYTLWGWMVRGAGDPARARELVTAHPASQAVVGELVLEDLARRGRIRSLVTTAHALGAIDRGALQLAIWGRPIAALELAAAARHHTPELACARALACYRAGRPDLTRRILAEDPPPAELTGDEPPRPFPGPDERWRIERAAAAHPALVALAGGAAAIAALAQPAAHDADPDSATIDPMLAVEHRLGRGLAGATVAIAGELEPARRERLAAAVAAAGARLV
ncbi:MAG TPA: hypothetical protein VHW23_37385, partial [Kofleriaceae bacterium]|nr:hypothetical protein [Kofleriaceae bacterium]